MSGVSRYRQPGGLGPNDSMAIAQKIAELEKRIGILERNPQIGNTSIDSGSLTVNSASGITVNGGGDVTVNNGGSIFVSGNITITQAGELIVKDNGGNTIIELGKTSDGRYGLRVNDTSGNPQIRLGQLASGGYGLEVVSPGGQLTALGPFIFGPAAANINTGESTTSITYTDLATVGPSATVTIGNSGRALVLLGARFFGISDQSRMSFIATGANSLAASDSNCVGAGSPSATVNAEVSKHFYLTGLNAGVTTFTARYRSDNGPTAWFGDRSIAVFPY